MKPPITTQKVLQFIATAMLTGAFQKIGERFGGAFVSVSAWFLLNYLNLVKDGMTNFLPLAKSVTATAREPIKPVEKLSGFVYFDKDSMFWAVLSSVESAEMRDEEKEATEIKDAENNAKIKD